MKRKSQAIKPTKKKKELSGKEKEAAVTELAKGARELKAHLDEAMKVDEEKMRRRMTR